MPILDPAVLLLVAVGTLAIVGFLLWRLHAPRDRGRRRDSIPADVPAVVVGAPAREILDATARLDGAELQHLDQGYRWLDRYRSGRSEERLLELVDGFFQILQPTGGGSGSIPLLRTSELRAMQAVGAGRERALLARAATAIEHAAGEAGKPISWQMAQAVADASMAVEAGDELEADDRAMLAWPWRDAVEHQSTIPDPGTVVPRRTSVAVGGVAVLLAVLVGFTGDAPSTAAAAGLLVIGGAVIAAISLFRMMAWHPILRVPPVRADVRAAQRSAPPATQVSPDRARRSAAPDFGPRVPAFARGGASGIGVPALLLGVLVIPAIWIVLYLDDRWRVGTAVGLGLVLLVSALPAFLAGIIGVRSARGAVRTMVWFVAGVTVAAICGLGFIAVTADPGGEMWPWLAVAIPVVVGPPVLLGYGAGALLATWRKGR